MTKSEGASDNETWFWNDGAVAIVAEEPPEKRVYDLEERTALFGEAVWSCSVWRRSWLAI